ncbi:porin family protein [Formosa sp. L2A11]|uniref:porin family protein n=1 Tax=Formosa sp. L2A11 TaxID=2686363 RepID=UPI00131CED70|nr:porin family protein [Formosa sp. L2A11]
MKKITFLVLTILATTTSFAQFDLFGVRAGINMSNLDYDSEVPSGNAHRNGFVVGFTAQYGISDKFSIAPEIQFSAEGAKEESLRLSYLNLPVFAKYAVTERLSVGLGPQLGLKVHEFEDGFNNLVFSGIAGVEYIFLDDFYVDVRYSYGITNVYDDDQILEAKNSNIQVGLGIKIF